MWALVVTGRIANMQEKHAGLLILSFELLLHVRCVLSSVPAAKAELKRVQAAAEQQRAVMVAELSAAQTAAAAARAEASKARAAHASCCCQLQEAQQEVSQVCSQR